MSYNPTMLRLYRLPKIHQNDNFKPEFSVKDSLDFTARLKDFPLHVNNIFNSLYVSNLFISVLYSETIPLVENILEILSVAIDVFMGYLEITKNHKLNYV